MITPVVMEPGGRPNLGATCSIDTLDPLNDSAWDRALDGRTDAGIFHTGAWARVLASTYGHRPHYLRLRRHDGASAFVPLMEVSSIVTGRRGVSVPFADSCAPLVSPGLGIGDIAPTLADYAGFHDWSYLEIRGGEKPGPSASAARGYHEHVLDLSPDLDALWEGVAPASRRNVRRARRAGLAAVVERDEESVRQYYVLHTLTRRRQNLPPQPLRFFLNLHREIIGPGNGTVVLVRKGGRCIAGAVFLHTGGNAIYKFGASDPGVLDLRPNHLAMWHGIAVLAGSGIRRLSFGRTDIGHSGLDRFKRSWGAGRRPLAYFRHRPGAGWRAEGGGRPSRGIRLFGSCPLLVNRLAGTCIYPHLD